MSKPKQPEEPAGHQNAQRYQCQLVTEHWWHHAINVSCATTKQTLATQPQQYTWHVSMLTFDHPGATVPQGWIRLDHVCWLLRRPLPTSNPCCPRTPCIHPSSQDLPSCGGCCRPSVPLPVVVGARAQEVEAVLARLHIGVAFWW